jgi:putative DNA primase/helicase
VAAAGALAAARAIVPWTETEATQAAATCFRAWLEDRGDVGSREVQQIINHLQYFLGMHGMRRFVQLSPSNHPIDDTVPNRAGFRRRAPDGRWEYLFMPKVWTEDLWASYDVKLVNSTLGELGYLNRDGQNRFSHPVSIAGYGRLRVYIVGADILGEPDAATPALTVLEGREGPAARTA